jgi:hypothetical protein
VFYFSSQFIGELQYPITRDIVFVPLHVFKKKTLLKNNWECIKSKRHYMAQLQLSKAIAEPPAKRHNNNRFNMYRPYHIRTLLATFFYTFRRLYVCILSFTIYLAFDLFSFFLVEKEKKKTMYTHKRIQEIRPNQAEWKWNETKKKDGSLLLCLV